MAAAAAESPPADATSSAAAHASWLPARRQAFGVHAAILAFEASAEFRLCEASGGRRGVVDIDALLAAAGSPPLEVPPPPPAPRAPQLHGVGWAALSRAWMVRSPCFLAHVPACTCACHAYNMHNSIVVFDDRPIRAPLLLPRPPQLLPMPMLVPLSLSSSRHRCCRCCRHVVRKLPTSPSPYLAL